MTKRNRRLAPSLLVAVALLLPRPAVGNVAPPAASPISAGAPASVVPPAPPQPLALSSSTPAVLDNFNRTTTDPYWGTASSGAGWATYNPTFCTGYTSAVDGSAGTMTGSAGASCSGNLWGGSQLTYPTNPSLRYWEAPNWQFTGKFKASAIDNSQLNLYIDLAPSSGVSLYLSPTAGSVTLERALTGDATTSFTWLANTWYSIKWAVIWGDQARLKVWPTSDPEPTDWLLATAGTSLEDESPFVIWWRSTTGPTKVSVDDFAFGPAPVLPKLPPPPETEHNPPFENQEAAGDPVSSYTGTFSDRHVDIAIPGRGPMIEFARSYNSNDPRVTSLGPGWTHSYNIRLVDPNDGSSDIILIGPQGRSDRYVWTGSAFTPPTGVQRSLVRNADLSYTARDKAQTVWLFDPSGRLDEIVDRYGNASTMTYETSGRLSKVRDPAGRGDLTFTYTNGLLTSVADWATPVRTVSFQYDANGRLWKATDREGKTTTYSYEGSSHRLATITNARGNVILTNGYDASGRVATQQDARGLITGDVTTFAYVVNPDGTRVTTVTAPATSFEPTFHPTLVDSYDATGQLTTRVTNPTSADTLTQSFTYDAAGNQTSTTDARGNRTDFCYDVDYAGATIAGGQANLTRRIDPPPSGGANRPVTLFQYDASNNVTQAVTPKGVPSGQVVTCATNLAAIDTLYAQDFAYDPARVYLLSTTTRYTDPDIGARTAVTKYEYGDASNPGLVTRVIPPRGNTAPSPDYTYATTSTYYTSGSRAGLLKDVTDPVGNLRSLDYDSIGRLISSVDALGNPAIGGYGPYHDTRFTYDKEDRLRTQSVPGQFEGSSRFVSETRYDEVGNPIVRIDANGQVTTFAYDERNSLWQVKESPQIWTDPASPPTQLVVTEYTRDAGGNPTRITRAKGDPTFERATDYVYDGRGQPRSESQYPAWPSTAGALVTTFGFDAAGNQSSVVDPLGQTLTIGYDALNRKISLDYSDPATADVTHLYDANGNRIQMVDGTGTTTYVVDEADRPVAITAPGPASVGYRYDLDGHRTKLIYPDSTAVTYTFDKAGQLASLSDWAARTVSYTYWPDGLVKTALSPDGSTAAYGYDTSRRLIDIAHAGPSGQLLDRSFYTLDATGNVTAVNHGLLGSQAARPDGLTGSNGTWSGTYASIDEVVPSDSDLLASPSGPAAPQYYEVSLSNVQAPMDLTGIKVRYRISKSGNNAGQTTSLLVELRQGSTVIWSHSFQSLPGATGSGWLQITDSVSALAASQITDFSDLRLRFTPSSSGGGQARKAQISWAELEVPSPADPAAATTYGYDGLYRLTSALDSAGARTYDYDPVGNRVTKVGGAATTYAYDRADRLTAAGAVSVTVDANGNLTAKGADTFGFDQANRLTSATVAGTTETYAYDGDGTRFSRQVGAGPVTRYVVDRSGPLAKTLDDGVRKYVYGLDLAYAVAGSSIEVYHADRLGSIRALTDGGGAVVATYRVDEWGRTTGGTGGSGQPFGFTGESRDATGLTYLRTRYYDPDLGRFLSRDTWSGAPGAPQTQNRYAYVANNPVTAADPTGRWLDTLLDAAFVVYDIASLMFGPEKDRGSNWLALGADVGSVFLPFVTGLGPAVRAGAKTADHVDDAIGGSRWFDDAATAACSFTAETLVATPDGPVPISSISVGDVVLAWDDASGEVIERTVTAVLPHPDDEVAYVTFDDGSVTTTPDHPFFTLEAGWVEAGLLWPGARVKTASGAVVVVSVATEAFRGQLWDLAVEGAHTFFVGSGKWLVHNCGDLPWQFRDTHHANQLATRGWTSEAIDSVIHNPVLTVTTKDRATGQAATAYYRADMNYVIRNDVTGDIVQISNITAASWFDDVRGVWR